MTVDSRACLLPGCPTEFPAVGRRLYCTTGHARRDKSRRRAELGAATLQPGATCPLEGCDQPSRGGGVQTAYCSDGHYNKAWRLRTNYEPPSTYVKKTFHPQNCALPACEVVFTPAHPVQRYCTRAHAQQHYARIKRSDPAFVAAVTARSRAWREANPDRARIFYRNAHLRRMGLTSEQFAALEAATDGACWLCQRSSTELTRGGRVRRLHIDHDHRHEIGDPDGIRGLLDTGCNTRLAVVEDRELVAAIAAYLDTRSTYEPPPALESDTRSQARWHAFRLTDGQYAAMLAVAKGVCEICHAPEATLRSGRTRPLSVDHDHTKSHGEPGFIRGLLCNTCNTAVGVIENTAWLELAHTYLRTAPGRAQRLLRSAHTTSA